MDVKKEFIETDNSKLKVTTYESKKQYNKMPSGYGIVQREIMIMDISIQAKAIYCLLASYTGSKEYCFPSIITIANNLKISEKLVYKYMKELKQNGLIIVSKLFSDQRNNHKYEICYIDTPQNVNVQGVEIVNVEGSQNIPFINNNNINNNNINNICDDKSSPVPVKKQLTKKEPKLYFEKTVAVKDETFNIDLKFMCTLFLDRMAEIYNGSPGIPEYGLYTKSMKSYIESLDQSIGFEKAIDILYTIIKRRCYRLKTDDYWVFDGKTIMSIVKEQNNLYAEYLRG